MHGNFVGINPWYKSLYTPLGTPFIGIWYVIGKRQTSPREYGAGKRLLYFTRDFKKLNAETVRLQLTLEASSGVASHPRRRCRTQLINVRIRLTTLAQVGQIYVDLPICTDTCGARTATAQ